MVILLIIHEKACVDLIQGRKLFNEYIKGQPKLKKMTKNEIKVRFGIFMDNVKFIKNSYKKTDSKGRPLLGGNRNGPNTNFGNEDLSRGLDGSYVKGINKFALMSDREFDSMYLIKENIMNRKSKAQKHVHEKGFGFDDFEKRYNQELQCSKRTVLLELSSIKTTVNNFGGRSSRKFRFLKRL